MSTGTDETQDGYCALLSGLTGEAVAEQRVAVTKWLEQPGLAKHKDNAASVVDELLANVIRHAGGDALMRVRLEAEGLVISVMDKSEEEPVVRPFDWEQECGRGMNIVNALSSDWGVRPCAGGKVVWALLGDEESSEPDPPPCFRCKSAVENDQNTLKGAELRRGKPDSPIIFCAACTRLMEEQRAGVDTRTGELCGVGSR